MKLYDSTVARIAGNIASGLAHSPLLANTTREEERIVEVSVRLANAIVDKLKADLRADDGMYYIENLPNNGDCCRWWRPDGKGYTRVLDEAWKLDKMSAERICSARPDQDVMRLVSDVDAKAVRHLGR